MKSESPHLTNFRRGLEKLALDIIEKLAPDPLEKLAPDILEEYWLRIF